VNYNYNNFEEKGRLQFNPMRKSKKVIVKMSNNDENVDGKPSK
jgi:hypothetical protein